MSGGVAVAAGTGVLPSPFGDRGDPTPAASVSGVASPDRPLVSPSPDGTVHDEVLPDGSASPDDAGSPSAGNGDARPESKGSTRTPAPRATESGKASEGMHRRLIEACLRYRGGELGADERQRLRGSARKYGRSTADLNRFCDRVLGRSDGSSEYGGSDDSDGPNGSNGSNGSNGLSGQDGRDGDEDDDSDSGGHHDGPGSGSHGGSGSGTDQNAGYQPIAPAPPRSPSHTPSRAPDLPGRASPALPTATATPSPSA
ncbi:hypothetical protein OKJ48_07930 [Streptomyces kunmingensis]|uniref:Uncharacterized protein n=1 Tax=Streptomyces kunmingensis TaxID=68225 RepID=A0ABU6C6D7_9ACTN|nr:hypothetical protein [Streptomyces kunmingensis]MEB3960177.1 hypothetical protein [Streptomyces kunmingensis]